MAVKKNTGKVLTKRRRSINKACKTRKNKACKKIKGGSGANNNNVFGYSFFPQTEAALLMEYERGISNINVSKEFCENNSQYKLNLSNKWNIRELYNEINRIYEDTISYNDAFEINENITFKQFILKLHMFVVNAYHMLHYILECSENRNAKINLSAIYNGLQKFIIFLRKVDLNDNSIPENLSAIKMNADTIFTRNNGNIILFGNIVGYISDMVTITENKNYSNSV